MIAWSNRQRVVPAGELQLEMARRAVERAWPDIFSARRRGSFLAGLDAVSVVLVSDRRIAVLHGEFMGDPSPTDVITFLHGEVVVSAETARREARARGLPVAREVALYAIHGLLHLAEWTDTDPQSAAAMRAMQGKILRRAARGVC